jgi:hypothetical protein
MVSRRADDRSGSRTILSSVRKTNWSEAGGPQESNSTGIADLQLLDRVESLVPKVKSSFFRLAKRWPGGGKELESQTPGNQRQNAKRNVNHACPKSTADAKQKCNSFASTPGKLFLENQQNLAVPTR